MNGGSYETEGNICPKLLVPKMDGRFLVTGKNDQPRTKNNDFEHRRAENLEYFLFLNELQGCTIRIVLGSWNYMFYSDEEKAILCKVNNMEEVYVPRECITFIHKNVQHMGGGRQANHALRYHVYLTPEDFDWEHAAAFAHGYSMQYNVQNEHKAPLGDVDPLYPFDQKETAHDRVFTNTITAQMTWEGDKISAIDVWPDYSKDSPIEKDQNRSWA